MARILADHVADRFVYGARPVRTQSGAAARRRRAQSALEADAGRDSWRAGKRASGGRLGVLGA